MNLFQLIAAPVATILCVRSALSFARGKHPRGASLAAAVIWFLSSLFILRPDLTMRVARVLGIGRGADLVLYIFAILFIISFFYFHGRFRFIESQLTEIVRHLSFSTSDLPDKGAQSDSPRSPEDSSG